MALFHRLIKGTGIHVTLIQVLINLNKFLNIFLIALHLGNRIILLISTSLPKINMFMIRLKKIVAVKLNFLIKPIIQTKNRKKEILCLSPPYNMAVASRIGKESFLGYWKKESPLLIHYNKNTIKLSYSRMNNVANLIRTSNCNKHRKKQYTEPSNAFALIKPGAPLTVNVNTRA